jgi:hypothetical protein
MMLGSMLDTNQKKNKLRENRLFEIDRIKIVHYNVVKYTLYRDHI